MAPSFFTDILSIKFHCYLPIYINTCIELPMYIYRLCSIYLANAMFVVSLFHLLFIFFQHLFWCELIQWFCKSSWRHSHTRVMSFFNIKFNFQTLKLISSLTLFRRFEPHFCHLISKLLGTRSPSFQPMALVSGENFCVSVGCGVSGKSTQTRPLSLPTQPELPE